MFHTKNSIFSPAQKSLLVEASQWLELYQQEADEQYLQEAENILLSFTPKTVRVKKDQVLLTISAGGGGLEAQDFAEKIETMLLKFCDNQKYKIELLDRQETFTGLRTAQYKISGKECFNNLRHEHGSHRLSRISPYGKGGKRQTSFCRVEVIPLIKNASQKLNMSEVDISRFKGSGPGGQHRNKTETGIRAKHIPTNIVVTVSNGRSLAKNQQDALEILEQRVNRNHLSSMEKRVDEFKGGSAGFGQRIRSYIFDPKHLVHDHQTGNKTHELEKVLFKGRLEFIR